MSSMRLYQHPDSTFCRRVRMALSEKSIDVEAIDLDRDARARPEYRAINPYGRIPALEHGGLVLYESTAILEYLEAMHPEPSLLPHDPAGRALAAMHMKLCDLEFTQHAVLVQRPKRLLPEAEWDHAAMAAATRPVVQHLRHLDAALRDRQWLVGDAFSLVEICYAPFLHFLHLLDVTPSAAVAGWSERILARDSARATVPAR